MEEQRMSFWRKNVILGMLAAAMAPAAHANFNTNEGFESGTGDWTASQGITRVPHGGGTLRLPSSAGNFHGEIQNQLDGYQTGYGDAGYTRFGGNDTTYHGDFYQSIDVYIDVNWAPAAPAYADSFWIDMTPYRVDTNNFGAEHNFRLKALGNAVEVRVDGGAVPIATITASGWHRFEITWSKGANPTDIVTSRLTVFDHSGTKVGVSASAVADSPGGPLPSSDLRGNGYAWITLWPNGFAADVLAIDNAQTGPINRYVVTPPELGKALTYPFAFDPDSLKPMWASGAPTNYGQSSFYASVTNGNGGANPGNRYRTLRVVFDSLFGRPVPLNEVAGFSYWTYKAAAGDSPTAIDWRGSLYTKPTGTGDFSWYRNRIQADTFVSYASPANLNAPANQWNQWSTGGAQNTLRFYDRNRFAADTTPSTRDITWQEIKTGPVNRNATTYDYSADVAWFLDIVLGANSGGGTGASQLDGVRVTLTNGEVADIDLASAGNFAGADLLHLRTIDASFFVKPAETCVINLNVANLSQPVSALQAMLNFSSTYFQSGANQVNVVAGGGVWDELIYNLWNTGGDLDVAVGVDLQLSGGTQLDGTTAIITLAPTGVEGISRMVFRPDASPDPGLTQSTVLAGVSGNPIMPLKYDSVSIFIDGTAPTLTSSTIVATQIQPYAASPVVVKNSANPTVQGEVDLTLEAADLLAGLEGVPTIVLTNGTAVETATYVSETPFGTFHYYWDVTAATRNGIWTATATATDKAGNATVQTFTLNVNKDQITGQIDLEGFTGTGTVPAHTRTVTFVSNGGAKTWSLPLTNTTGSLFAYTLIDVPAGTNAVSATTAWSLRSKVSGLVPDAFGQTPANFTDAQKLLAGDLNATNSINVMDYSVLKAQWFTASPAADVTGDGVVNNTDYNLMKANWFKMGSPQ